MNMTISDQDVEEEVVAIFRPGRVTARYAFRVIDEPSSSAASACAIAR